ncbi:chemotaxis protein histidine kinase CheA [Agrobacterium larrymoorei]|uniref:Chemotaxis protein histidine kinase CheA n=1 Tax=Agrobacterium larrymoorei TaxID=160699 RepID=A0AAJ2BCP3_9HYPH|nr:hypothetical protein [Agrobacterium larrymoorei]MDR6103109.1 chemotaxis protein histidine kinase CheA [Agrobacterium larrymoorei]
MADFVAVIRKAVDGLANNTPENRAKVYDKARSAVVRQLENMKPRPPEEMLQRQIMKLDTAIAEVEGEYSEALPALEDEDEGAAAAYATPAPEDVSSPYYEESVAQEQRYADEHRDEAEPAHHDDHSEPEQHETYAAHDDGQRHEEREPAYQAEPAEEVAYRAEEPAEHAELYQRPASYETPETHQEPETYQHEAPAYAHEHEDEHHGLEARHESAAEEDHAHRNWVGQDSHLEPAPWEREETEVEDHSHDGQLHAAYHHEEVAHDDDRHEETHQHDYTREEPREAEPFSTETVLHENAPLPYTAGFDGQSNYYGNVSVEPENRPVSDDAHYAAFEEHDAHRDPSGTPQVTGAGKAPAPVDDFSSYFQDTALDLPPKTSPSLPRADEDPFAASATKDDKERTPWDDLEELIGYDGGSNDRSDKTANGNLDSGFTGAGIPAAAYATKKKPKRNYAGMVLGLGLLVVLAGGGYAAWTNREALNDMVGGLVNSAKTGTSTDTSSGGTSQTASAPANGGATATQPATNGQTPAQGQASTGTPAATRPADDGSVTGTKFTQRLLADGTEKDEGPGPGANGQPVTAEGQSVYQQNEAPSAQNTATAAPAAAGNQPVAQQTAAPAAATGDRMFLYEEVLGQTVPTAIEGKVSWTLQNETDDAGKPSPEVQGQINIPGRGLSALITFKRNTDPSLPASHLVEIVFSVSPGFEGGAIDSVQRIAMKSTEQDRGNALIAVPAKITDDFHMIALNDFPDARKTNLELLRTRDWIDIPVSYRNGRRALLTLQKGADGKAAFETALREWMAASPTTGQ